MEEKLPVLEVARRTGISRGAVWRWQQRFAEEGVDGLLHDKTRKPGNPPLPPRRGADMVIPGDSIVLAVELHKSVALEPDTRFAFREGNRTVGHGVVTRIIE